MNLRTAFIALWIAFGTGSTAFCGEFYVSPTGAVSGDGSIAKPWDLQTALNHPRAVKPGDTLWIRGGTYGNGVTIFYSRLVGTSASPIVVRRYREERPIVNGWLQVGCCDRDPQPAKGAYVWFWGLEFASSVTDRTGAPAGPPKYGESKIRDAIDTWAPGSKFIHNVIHDTRMGISMWKEAIGAEAYGNVIYFNGFQATDRAHGHGFYVQNMTGVMSVIDNIIFDQFNHGMQFYGSEATFVKNLLVQGNIVFDNGAISKGPNMGDNVVFANSNGVAGTQLLGNHLYFKPEKNLGYNELGWTGNHDLTVRDNYFIGGFQAIALGEWKSVTAQNNTIYSQDKYLIRANNPNPMSWDNNRYFGSGLFQTGTSGTDFTGWRARTGNDKNSKFQRGAPAGLWTFVLPSSKYEPGRANIVVYNWDKKPSVALDLGKAIPPGTSFEIRDVENYFAPPVLTGVYSGSPVTIPMTGLKIAVPNGGSPTAPAHTAPLFGVFVLQQTGRTSGKNAARGGR